MNRPLFSTCQSKSPKRLYGTAFVRGNSSALGQKENTESDD